MRPSAPFEGYPYLVARIGRTALRHLAVLPADWSRQRLIELARRQAEATQFDTCLCLGPGESIFVRPDREPAESTFEPFGLPITDRLALAEPSPETAELSARRAALRDFVEANKGSGYLVGDGLEGGRPAAAEDLARLSGDNTAGLPPGLRRCPACRSARGEFLALRGEGNGDRTPRVVAVHCECDNHNRCAGCGLTLAPHRLSAYRWDDESARVQYMAAYIGLGHRCGTAA